MDQLVRSFLNPAATLTISVDQIAASLKKKKPATTVAVNNDPPQIFVSFKPAILLMINGSPVLAGTLRATLHSILLVIFV